MCIHSTFILCIFDVLQNLNSKYRLVTRGLIIYFDEPSNL